MYKHIRKHITVDTTMASQLKSLPVNSKLRCLVDAELGKAIRQVEDKDIVVTIGGTKKVYRDKHLETPFLIQDWHDSKSLGEFTYNISYVESSAFNPHIKIVVGVNLYQT